MAVQVTLESPLSHKTVRVTPGQYVVSHNEEILIRIRKPDLGNVVGATVQLSVRYHDPSMAEYPIEACYKCNGYQHGEIDKDVIIDSSLRKDKKNRIGPMLPYK